MCVCVRVCVCVFSGQTQKVKEKTFLDYKHLENAVLMGSCSLSLHWEFAAVPWEADPSSQQSGLLPLWSAG